MSRDAPGHVPGCPDIKLLVKAEPDIPPHCLRGCLLAGRPPEGCGERPINGLHTYKGATTSSRIVRGAFSVVADGGYLLGMACRIVPSVQATSNFDSAKLPVNSNGKILYPF